MAPSSVIKRSGVALAGALSRGRLRTWSDPRRGQNAEKKRRRPGPNSAVQPSPAPSGLQSRRPPRCRQVRSILMPASTASGFAALTIAPWGQGVTGASRLACGLTDSEGSAAAADPKHQDKRRERRDLLRRRWQKMVLAHGRSGGYEERSIIPENQRLGHPLGFQLGDSGVMLWLS